MKMHLAAFSAGLIFAVGLGVSGMTQVDKVVNFLNVAGAWDPSLAVVMIGAIGVHLLAYRVVPSLSSPVADSQFRIPTRTDIDARLVAGGAIFGAGWAITGFCPGPGLVAAASGSLTAMSFLGGMLGGMVVFQVFERLRSGDAGQAPVATATGA